MPIGMSCKMGWSGSVITDLLPSQVACHRRSAARVDCGSILRFVELPFDPGANVAWTLHLRQTFLEHELGDAACRRHFRFQYIGLAWEQHALRAKFRANLISARLSGDDETFIGDELWPCDIGCEPDRREDVEIIRLSWVECLAVQGHIRELHTGC